MRFRLKVYLPNRVDDTDLALWCRKNDRIPLANSGIEGRVETKALLEEGIEVHPLPIVPDERN